MSFFNGWIFFGKPVPGVRQPVLLNKPEELDTPVAIIMDPDQADDKPLIEPSEPSNWLTRPFVWLGRRIQSSSLLDRARRVLSRMRESAYNWTITFLLATYRITGIFAALYLFADEYLTYFFGWDLYGQIYNGTMAAESKGPGFFFPLKAE